MTPDTPPPPSITLDLEGVFTPEIWIEFSNKTGIAALRRTTRDEPDYDKLMRYRIDILEEHGLTLADIQEVIGGMDVLPGAREFLDWLRGEAQVIILSDTFYEFAAPLMRQAWQPHPLLQHAGSGRARHDRRLSICASAMANARPCRR